MIRVYIEKQSRGKLIFGSGLTNKMKSLILLIEVEKCNE